jgi:hypothetical protein
MPVTAWCAAHVRGSQVLGEPVDGRLMQRAAVLPVFDAVALALEPDEVAESARPASRSWIRSDSATATRVSLIPWASSNGARIGRRA